MYLAVGSAVLRKLLGKVTSKKGLLVLTQHERLDFGLGSPELRQLFARAQKAYEAQRHYLEVQNGCKWCFKFQ